MPTKLTEVAAKFLDRSLSLTTGSQERVMATVRRLTKRYPPRAIYLKYGVARGEPVVQIWLKDDKSTSPAVRKERVKHGSST